MKTAAEKRKEFTQLIAGGASRADAYRKAFERPEMSNYEASRRAWGIMKTCEVAEKLEKIKEFQTEETKEAALDRRARIGLLSMKAIESANKGRISDMVKCIAELNKMEGAYEPSKVEVSGDAVENWVKAQIEKAAEEPLVKSVQK